MNMPLQPNPILDLSSLNNYERATRVDIHSILVLGPSALGKGEITSENGNLRNLRYTKNMCHMILALITSEYAHPIILVEQLK